MNIIDITGPKDADTAILSIYDIFGFFPQTLQGADILAYSNKQKQCQVIIPDFFEGKPCDPEWYPPTDADKQAKLGAWFATVDPPKQLPKVQGFLAEAEKLNPNIKSWGVIGYCWGGKMVSLIAGRQTKFKAAVQTSPAMVDPADASKVTIPMAMLASKDEDAETVKKYEEALTTTKHVEIFADVGHGWMSSRTNIQDPKVKAEYERGYEIAVRFFHDHL
jgi:dienelactone hydrolase